MLSFEKVMEDSKMGYARHKMIYDKKGKPVDYQFLSVNSAFEKLTGLQKKELINQRVTQVLPKITEGEFDWIGYYGSIAETVHRKTFEQYSYPLDRWYRVEAFSYEKGYFTTVFTDITHERELVEASKAFLDEEEGTNAYEAITQRMKRITGACYVVLNIFLEEGGKFQTVAIAGVSSSLQKVARMLGFNPLKKIWDIDPRRFELIREKSVTTFEHLHELTDHFISKTVIQLLEKTFNVGQTVIIKITQGERIIGDFTLMFSKGNQLQNENEAMIYADMVGMLIEKRKKQQALDENEKQLRESQQRYRSIAEDTPAMICRVLPDMRIDYANQVYCEYFGRVPESLIGTSFLDLIPPEEHKAIRKVLSKLTPESPSVTYEEQVYSPDGKGLRWQRWRNRALFDEAGQIVSYQTIGMDITEERNAHKELKSAHKRLYTVLNSLDAVVYIADIDTYEILQINAHGLKTWGDIVGKKCWQIMQDDQEGPCSFCHNSQLVDDEGKPTVVYRWEHKNPIDNRWYECWDRVIEWIDGRMVKMAFAADITERKKTESDLRKSEKKFRTLFDTLAEGVVYHNLEGKIIDANPSAEEILGLPLSQILERTYKDPRWHLIHEDGSPIPAEEYPSIMAAKTGQPLYGKIMGVYHPQEEEVHWVKANAIPQIFEGEKKPKLVSTSFEDITQEIQAKQRAQESERSLQEVYDGIQDGITVLDTDMNIIQYNKWIAESHTCGQPLLGRKCYEVFHNRQTPCPECPSVKCLASGNVETEVVKSFSETGECLWTELSAFPVKDDNGKVKKIIEYGKDITEKKQAEWELKRLNKELLKSMEEAKKANQAKSLFLANMSHELRTPLNGIIGFSDILKSTPLNDEQNGFLDIVYSSAKHLTEIIADILDFSKIEAGKLELSFEETDLRKLVDDTCSIARFRAQSKGLTLNYSVTSNVPRTVDVDGPRLRQILVNLLTNAVKFTDVGAVKLTVSLVERLPDKVRLLFMVTDTGMGIKEKDQARIFEPFHQADMSTSKRAQGTGLGLAIVNNLLKKMGSALELKSIYGEGSTFAFELLLSCDREQPADLNQIDTVIKAEGQSFNDKKVLVAEDNPVNMHYLHTALSMFSKDIQVITAEDGKEAYKQYLEHKPDLILMDIVMPEVDGYQVTKMIREHDTQIPIIAMTAQVLKGVKEDSLSAGTNDYIAKPVTLDQLREILEKYL